MSIKNKDKIHFIRKGRYICIGAVYPIKIKSTKRKDKVTCKNCLRILEKK